MEWFVFIFLFYTILFLCLSELNLLILTFTTPRALAFWMEVMQLQFVPPHGLLLKNPFSFLGMCILILTDMGFLWFTSACGKWVVGDFLEWKYLPHLHQVRMYQRTRQQLTYLYMLARSENERMQLLHQRMQVRVHEDASSSLLAAPTSVIQPVGPFSKFYLFLSNYLFPLPFQYKQVLLLPISKRCVTPA